MQQGDFWPVRVEVFEGLVTSLPRVCSFPPYSSSRGGEAIEVARSAGLVLDDWQQYVLERALGRRDGDRWAAFEVGVNVSRQNGKGGILEARELAGLFVFGERLIIHSAHQFDTSLEAFRRLLMLIEDTPELDQQVRRVSRSHGEEGIELMSRQRIRFRTRTKGGGRGFTGDCLILDEAMILAESSHGALLPTLSARPDPQVWYTGSAVDQLVHEDGVVFARVRERGAAGSEALAYFEWSVEADSPDALADEVAEDPVAWQQANPALGIRISEEHVRYESWSMDPRTFAVERLGVGDWPPTSKDAQTVIPIGKWDDLADVASRPEDPVCFAYDVAPSRLSASIAAAGRRSDGLPHVEIVDHHDGTGWVVDRLVELCARHRPAKVLGDNAGPSGSLLAELERRHIPVEAVTATEHGRACGALFDAVDQGDLRHLGTRELRTAIKGAKTRPLGDSWAWARAKSTADISPLVAATLALWGVGQEVASVYESRGFAAV